MTQIKSKELAIGMQIKSEYRNENERIWAEEGFKDLEKLLKTKITLSMYEGCTFNLGKNKYTPDFMHFLDDQHIVFVEVKSSVFSRGYQQTKLKLKTTAAKFSMFIFYEALKVPSGWKLTKI